MQFGLFTCGYQRFTIEDAFRDARDFGYDYIELYGGFPHAYAPDLLMNDREKLKEILSYKEKYHMPIRCFTPEHNGYMFNFMTGDDNQWERTMDYLRLCLYTAGLLGAEFMMISAGHSSYLTSKVENRERLIKTLRELIEAAEENEVKLLLEPLTVFESNICTDVTELSAILSEVESPWLVSMTDLAVPFTNHEDAADYVRKLEQRFEYLHITDNDGISDSHIVPGEGCLPLEETIRGIREAGFDGCATIELVTNYLEEPSKYSKKAIDHIKKILSCQKNDSIIQNRYVLHAINKKDFDREKALKRIGQQSLDNFGFVHCSDLNTYKLVAPNFRDEQEEKYLLIIDTDRLSSDIRWEDCGGWDFPHIYGLINESSIVEILPHLWSSGKEWIPNDELIKYPALYQPIPIPHPVDFSDFPDDEWPFDYIDHDRATARAIVFSDDGLFHFVHLDRDDDFGVSSVIETSGGGVEPLEDLNTAIIRELKEELGADVEVICKIGVVSDYYNLIHRHNINNYFLCRAVSFGKNALTQNEIDNLHMKDLHISYEEALKQYEQNKDCKLGRLITKRELMILKYAKLIIDNCL